MPSMARISFRTSGPMGESTETNATSSPLTTRDRLKLGDINPVIAEDGADRTDDSRSVHDLESKERAFGNHVQVESVEKHDPPEFIGEDGPGYADLLDIGFELENDEVVEFVEGIGF